MKRTKNILLSLLCLSLLLCACTSVDPEKAFADSILAIPSTGSQALYVQLDTMEELFTVTKANLVVRCQVIERAETTVEDPFGVYTAELLTDPTVDERMRQGAVECIATPYTLQVTDVYFGDTYAEDDRIPYYAPYGILGDISYRQNGYPVLQVGEEYILFLRVDNVKGKWVYYPAHPLYSFYPVSKDTSLQTITRADTTEPDALAMEIQDLVAQNEFDAAVEYYS